MGTGFSWSSENILELDGGGWWPYHITSALKIMNGKLCTVPQVTGALLLSIAVQSGALRVTEPRKHFLESCRKSMGSPAHCDGAVFERVLKNI